MIPNFKPNLDAQWTVPYQPVNTNLLEYQTRYHFIQFRPKAQ